MKTALVLGATGLVGGHITRLLLNDPRVGAVHVFVRRTTTLVHPKLMEHVVDFDAPADWHHLLVGDVLFSALGTTLKQAGSQEAQHRVDVTYQQDAAAAAARQGVSTLVLISSAGADARSLFFYPRIKGELEDAVCAMGFASVCLIQPSMLVGERDHHRPGERFGVAVGQALRGLPYLKKWRPISGEQVARASIGLGLAPPPGRTVHALDQLFEPAQGAPVD